MAGAMVGALVRIMSSPDGLPAAPCDVLHVAKGGEARRVDDVAASGRMVRMGVILLILQQFSASVCSRQSTIGGSGQTLHCIGLSHQVRDPRD